MKPHKILIVEDDRNIRSGLADALEFEGYTVAEAADGSAALREFNSFAPDLILLDVMMPGLNGYEVCRQIRRSDPLIPIMMLTAKGEEIDKVLGLELGADDYVTKPFSLRELSARIAAQLRRKTLSAGAPAEAENASFRFAGWEIDVQQLRAFTDGNTVELTSREIKLLQFFAAHPNIVLERDRIMDAVWGSSFRSSRTLDQHLVALRRKIEPENSPKLIETVYGIGYRYTPPE
jgi:two-component system alkaline phosphatase synthesis response regulator PhoP